MIDRMECERKVQREKKRRASSKKERGKKKNLALLVDAENIGYPKANQDKVIAEGIGNIYDAYIYARQKDNSTKGWNEQALKLGFAEKRLYGKLEKDKVDSKIKRDALELLKGNLVDIFVLVT